MREKIDTKKVQNRDNSIGKADIEKKSKRKRAI